MVNDRVKDTISSMSSNKKASRRRGIVEDLLPYKDEGFPKDSLTRKLAYLGPWVSFGFFVLFALIFQAEVRWIFCSAAFILGGGIFIKPLIAGEFLKERGRDPSVIIAWTSLKSIAIVLALGLIILYMETPETPRWRTKTAAAQYNWEAEHPGEPFPKEEYFGFTIGETTFDEAMQILNDAGASFDIKYFEGTDIRRIETDSYEKQYPIPTTVIDLDFDDEGKVYSVEAWTVQGLKKAKIIDISKAFKYKYDKINSGSKDFDPGKYQEYYTPNGICVYFKPYLDLVGGKVKYTNLPKQEAVKKLREEARKRKAELTASKIFDSEA